MLSTTKIYKTLDVTKTEWKVQFERIVKKDRILKRFVSSRSIYADPPWWPGRSLGLWNKPDVHFNPISQNALLLLTLNISSFGEITYRVLNPNRTKREDPKVNSFPVYATLKDFSQVDDFPFKMGAVHVHEQEKLIWKPVWKVQSQCSLGEWRPGDIGWQSKCNEKSSITHILVGFLWNSHAENTNFLLECLQYYYLELDLKYAWDPPMGFHSIGFY